MNYAKELNSVQKNTFPGDSGGGLMSRNGDGIWFLLGIVSTGNICLFIYPSIWFFLDIVSTGKILYLPRGVYEKCDIGRVYYELNISQYVSVLHRLFVFYME